MEPYTTKRWLDTFQLNLLKYIIERIIVIDPSKTSTNLPLLKELLMRTVWQLGQISRCHLISLRHRSTADVARSAKNAGTSVVTISRAF